MDAHTINRMVSELPSPPKIRGRVTRRAAEVKAYAKYYSKLDFGHYFVNKLLESGKRVPAWLPEEDFRWLQGFYEFELGYDVEYMIEVLCLLEPEMSTQRCVMEAMLLDQDSSFASIARHTGWDENVIRGYERLFFNIRDRFGDHIFISKVAYPDTRIVETYSEYLENEDISNLMRRIGHNNGAIDVAHMAGIKSSLMYQMTEDSAAQKLENTIMANGFILARNGWLHSRNSEAVRSARMLIAAAKQGNEDIGETDPFVKASEVLMGELTKAKKKEAMEALPYQKQIYNDSTEVVVD